MKFSTNQPPQPYPEKGLLNVNNILNEDVEQKLHMIWLYLSNTLQKQNGLFFFFIDKLYAQLMSFDPTTLPSILLLRNEGQHLSKSLLANRQNPNGKEQMEWFHFTKTSD